MSQPGERIRPRRYVRTAMNFGGRT